MSDSERVEYGSTLRSAVFAAAYWSQMAVKTDVSELVYLLNTEAAFFLSFHQRALPADSNIGFCSKRLQ